MLRLTFNPFVSRQLYERKAFLRNPQCYKIRNPTAFKFLISYDKKIFAGNKLKLTLKEVTEYLQIDYKETDVISKPSKELLEN
ncbi:hypothetical protein AGMMS49921_10250 [Endomicrobiia bacterium]|nr:hypothetical protein AGMMS49921_10250 [Endomicrobiia bacterium]